MFVILNEVKDLLALGDPPRSRPTGAGIGRVGALPQGDMKLLNLVLLFIPAL